MSPASVTAAASALHLLLLAAHAWAAPAKLPSSYKTCKQNDPDFNGCLKEALQSAAPLLKNGIPSLGVPSIDPMPFATIKIQQGNKQRPVSVDVEFDNTLVYGMSRGFVDSVEMVPGSYHMKAHLRVDDPMYMIGTYKVEGKVLVLPIKGSGAYNITIGDNMNKFLNENKDLLVEDLKPEMELALAATEMDVARRLFSNVPYNSVFPTS
ncbi:protein takeout-like isoform X2 [Schistocerca nitens]|uniref:protein takeout-like isoform X2 n=1 Tax=Schistocerca nitens TaxID=7011 RepID=UPI0021180BEB|nr:protein takeout-like isoform X2 [Schistocerca nitens]